MGAKKSKSIDFRTLAVLAIAKAIYGNAPKKKVEIILDFFH